MSSGKQTVPTSSQSSQSYSGPSQVATGYINTGLQNAYNNYLNPTAGYQQAASNLLQPNAVAGQAQGLLGSILGGQFLDPNSNPYLNNTFNMAADATQNRLASEFAGSGRNLDASSPLRAQELNNLATSIYGGAYQQERGLMNQALGLAPEIAPLQANLYGQAGQYQNMDLNNYLQQIIGLSGASNTSTSSSVGNSQQTYFGGGLAGAAKGGLGGALTGAQIGSLVPGIGTAIGAGVGGLIGLIGGMG